MERKPPPPPYVREFNVIKNKTIKGPAGIVYVLCCFIVAMFVVYLGYLQLSASKMKA